MSADPDPKNRGRMQSADEGNRLEFPCPACGADLAFAAGSAALRCSHCGHEEAIPQSKDDVVERDISDYDTTAERGWGTEAKTYDCSDCGAKTTVEAKITSFTCPFCGSHQVDLSQQQEVIRPESVIPFSVDDRKVAQLFKDWIASLWFRPNALKALATMGRIRGVYIPHWTYDAMTHSFWEAESGEYYWETETYTDAEGNQQERQVRKTRWRWVNGTHDAFFDDVLVCASKGVDAALMVEAYPYDTKALVNYDPRFLAGWAAENYQREMPDCWPEARAFIDDGIRTAVIGKIPGDTHRSLSIDSSYLNRTYKHCLLPLWFASYRFSEKTWPVLVNGQTGEVVGRAPYSWVKITFAVLGVIGVIAVIAMLAAGGGATG